MKATTKISKKTAKKDAARERMKKLAAAMEEPEEPAPAPAPEPKPEVVAAPVLPAPPPLPEAIELVKDGKSRSGYVGKTAPDSKYYLRDRSEAAKPVTVVREICEANRDKTRKQTIDLCLAAGVNKNTAATQYSLWKKKDELAKALAADAGDDGEE